MHSHCRSGSYTRSRSYPVNPNSARQTQMKGIMAALSIAWNVQLTLSQKKTWIVYADNVTWLNRLAQTVKLTGFHHFVRSNAPRIQGGAARVDVAPQVFNLAAPEQELTLAATTDPDIIFIGFDDDLAEWSDEVGAYQFFWMGRPTNASQNFYGGPWRLILTLTGAPGPDPTSPQNGLPQWPYAQGQRLRIRSRISRADGRLSEFAYAEAIAT